MSQGTKNAGEKELRYLKANGGERLAFVKTPGNSPTVVFMGGYRSSMSGLKARAMERFCVSRELGFLRFDYRGHGSSNGRFEDSTMTEWLADARTVVTELTRGPLVLVGSSMGGWLALHLARELRSRVIGLLGIAAAPDFTVNVLEPELTVIERRCLDERGWMQRPSQYTGEPPIVFTRKLLDDARSLLVMNSPLNIHCPVELVHGMCDEDIPWQTATRLADRLQSTDVGIRLLKSGGHRLSNPTELEQIGRSLDELLARATDT